jgi:hypothetical protein
MNERYKEIIKYHTEILRVVFIIFFADLTGIISLIKKGSLTINEFRLFLAGILDIFALVIIVLKIHKKITSEIKKLW